MGIEKEYLIKIAEGDAAAFDFLFILHYPRVKNFIMGLVKNEEDARDIAQDIFLKIWNNRIKMPKIDYFKTYLFQMSKNAVFDFFKRHTTFENYDTVTNCSIEADNSPMGGVEIRDLEQFIDALIEAMPERRKEVYKMSRKEGLSNEEIAVRLNISKRTVETHISNILKDIKKII